MTKFKYMLPKIRISNLSPAKISKMIFTVMMIWKLLRIRTRTAKLSSSCSLNLLTSKILKAKLMFNRILSGYKKYSKPNILISTSTFSSKCYIENFSLPPNTPSISLKLRIRWQKSNKQWKHELQKSTNERILKA